MKGVVFNLLEEFITREYGEDAYEDILDTCALENGGVFIGPETYPDADFAALVDAACGRLGVTRADTLRAFGRFMFPSLLRRFPAFAEGHTHPRTFLKTVGDVIHVEVGKLMRETEPPEVTCVDAAHGGLILTYRSHRRLCALAEGLLDGAAAHFETPLARRQTACVDDGADRCEFDISFDATLERAS